MIRAIFVIFNVMFTTMLAGSVSAAEWKPDKAVEVIVGVAPGGALDITARDIQRVLQNGRLVSVPIAVENRPGAGSAIAWNYLNQHKGDGHYLAISAPNLITNALVGSNPLQYSDVTPIAMLFSEYIACSVRADSAIHSGHELVTRLRDNPESLSIGIASARGATNHIAAGVVLKAAGVDLKKLKFVVFKSSSESLTSLLGGHIDVDFSTVSNVLGHMQAGRIRVLGVTSPKRMPAPLQDIPTWTEQGLPVDFSGWRGVIGPMGLTREQVAYWDGVFAKVAKSREWQVSLDQQFWIGTYMNSVETSAFLQSQAKELSKVLVGLGLAK